MDYRLRSGVTEFFETDYDDAHHPTLEAGVNPVRLYNCPPARKDAGRL